ncbi:uncharacterized protein B0J16DRAFT_346627 [Fusarium flagelliforme]|uniref:uncharacterized protein n=1 Tax=Fusarium flagelliforme TaxID=2675880 RepID=UPI001E8E23E2|nr:uncharacterized protein B0J16DRAFT_346627 [Fusarium flagelliforme]KAH7179314.1 hypothetical protein B0J16DRAFT_346627 [Fusarium flagelliforme]
MASNEPLVEQEAERQLNPIACSHCRQRKRKCDRNLPHCLQCNNDPSNCHYPEQNKRGLPIGFITRLEARLAETEEALFRLVQSIEDPENNQVSLKPSSQRKDDRIREWDNLPLRNMEEVKTWYRNRGGLSGSLIVQDNTMDLDLDQQEASIRAATSDADPVEFTDDIQSSSGVEITQLDPEDDNISTGGNQIPVVSEGSKAREMEQKHPHMYF